jgi:hypothetical protein
MPPLEPISDNDVRPVTRGQTERLIAATERLADSNTWRKAARVLLALGMVGLLALGVSNFLLYQQVKAQASCRSVFAAARANALDDWIRALPSTTPKTPAELKQIQQVSQAKRLAYLKVSDQYLDAVRHSC